jgi:hypothetical protein
VRSWAGVGHVDRFEAESERGRPGLETKIEIGYVDKLRVRDHGILVRMQRRDFLRNVLGTIAAGRLGRAALSTDEIGACTAIAGYSLYQSIDLLRELGFATIEIHAMGVPEPTRGRFPGFQFDQLPQAGKKRVRAALKEFRHVTVHLPYAGLDYFSANEATARASVAQLEVALEAAAYFGAEVGVIHPQPASGYTLEQAWPVMLQRFRRWGDIAKKRPLPAGDRDRLPGFSERLRAVGPGN